MTLVSTSNTILFALLIVFLEFFVFVCEFLLLEWHSCDLCLKSRYRGIARDCRIDATFISLHFIKEEYEAARRVLVALEEVMSEEAVVCALIHCNNRGAAELHCSMSVCIYQENRDYKAV